MGLEVHLKPRLLLHSGSPEEDQSTAYSKAWMCS